MTQRLLCTCGQVQQEWWKNCPRCGRKTADAKLSDKVDQTYGANSGVLFRVVKASRDD